MKKIIVAACLVCLISLPMLGSGLKIHFGPAITNLNYSEASSLPSIVKQKSLFQFTGGVGFELSFAPNFALELDLMYAPGGTKFEATSGGVTASETFKGYAISLPMLFKVSFLTGTTPYVIAGGFLAYTTSQKIIIDVPGFHDEEDISDDVNRFQGGLIFGGGVEFSLASMKFLVEGRYSLGLLNLFKDPPPGESVKISNIFILVGYKF
ncbi:MAG TPA: porin family protein [Acidobacteriota bacterium]